jgi:hypothetical protein
VYTSAESDNQFTKIPLALSSSAHINNVGDNNEINMKIRLLGNRLRRGMDNTFLLFKITPNVKQGLINTDSAPSAFYIKPEPL